jgi:hypothetical protein
VEEKIQTVEIVEEKIPTARERVGTAMQALGTHKKAMEIPGKETTHKKARATLPQTPGRRVGKEGITIRVTEIRVTVITTTITTTTAATRMEEGEEIREVITRATETKISGEEMVVTREDMVETRIIVMEEITTITEGIRITAKEVMGKEVRVDMVIMHTTTTAATAAGTQGVMAVKASKTTCRWVSITIIPIIIAISQPMGTSLSGFTLL